MMVSSNNSVVRILFSLAFLTDAVHGGRVRRVIGGEEIAAGEYPWLVSLQGKVPSLEFFGIPLSYSKIYCGASLINERWLLTAAHCFTESNVGEKALIPKYWHARIGDIDLDADLAEKFMGLVGDVLNIDELKQFYVHPEKIILHPRYNRKDFWKHDIALVKLREAIPHTADILPHIQSVALETDNSFPQDGVQCVMKGWGCTEGGGAVIDKAKKVVLAKVNDRECGEFWGIEVDSRLCAGYNLAQKGICSGDSGGPLACRRGDGWTQVGVASFTSSHRPGNVPGAFTRVSWYADWINSTIEANTDPEEDAEDAFYKISHWFKSLIGDEDEDEEDENEGFVTYE